MTRKDRQAMKNNDLDYLQEELRPVVGFEGYLITFDGKIYSLKRKRFLDGEVCPSKKIGLFYRKYLLRKNGKTLNVPAHRLVYQSYVGPIPKKNVVHHIDGNGLNNSVSNLTAMTHHEHSRKIMIRWYLSYIYPTVHEYSKNGWSIPDLASKYELNYEIIETLLGKRLDEMLNDFNA